MTASTIPFASIVPKRSLEMLSPLEVNKLRESGRCSQYHTFRQCALAILSIDKHINSAKAIIDLYPEFDIEFIQQDRGLCLHLKNAPASAFVDGKMIASTREMLFSALRDIVYSDTQRGSARFDLDSSSGITDYVFHQLRNARAIVGGRATGIAVCWGGHSINNEEYHYSEQVGHELGLRGLNICTGCGAGAMKGPMKSGAVAHAKQRIKNARYLGLTEPSIIATEPPNPIVNELVIMPDIEKRLEAFVRVGHAIIIFPGGVGTAEELLYLLGVMLHPNNKELPLPIILTGPKSSAAYFKRLDHFISTTLGEQAQKLYRIIIDAPDQVARETKNGIDTVIDYRCKIKDAYYFNWHLHIDKAFQIPFEPTHQAVKALKLNRSMPANELAANLRRTFSSITAGNVKEEGIRLIEQYGPYEIHGDKVIMDALDHLLQSFVDDNRMKLPGDVYKPCYRLM